VVWVTRSERNWVRHHEDVSLQQAAQSAEAAFARTAGTLAVLLADPIAARMLAAHGWASTWAGRSTRLAGNHRAEGLAVLERVVLSKRLHALLSDVELVRWMSRHYPRELAILHDVCG